MHGVLFVPNWEVEESTTLETTRQKIKVLVLDPDP